MKATGRILVIDDDDNIRISLKRALSYAGFTVDVAEDGSSGLQKALTAPPDVVILDVMMPGLNGIDVCRRLKAGGDTSILMLTAKDEVSDRVTGLEAGADDYLIKPFALEELIARLRALLRRKNLADDDNSVHFADLTADLGTREVWRGKRLVELTAKEYDLLAMLLKHPRQVLTRDQLLEQVWGFNFESDTHVLEVYIRYLRQKLEAMGEPRLIHTSRGVGYVLKEPSP